MAPITNPPPHVKDKLLSKASLLTDSIVPAYATELGEERPLLAPPITTQEVDEDFSKRGPRISRDGQTHQQIVSGLKWAFLLNALAGCCSFTGYFISGSMALFSDAVLVTVDTITYLFNWRAEASREDENSTPLGYFAPMFSSVAFLSAGIFVIFCSIHKLIKDDPDDEINPDAMMCFATLGMCIDASQILFMLWGKKICGFNIGDGNDDGGIDADQKDDVEGSECAAGDAHSTDDNNQPETPAAKQQTLNLWSAYGHIIVDSSRSLMTVGCASMYYAGLSASDDTMLDSYTAIVTCSLGMLLCTVVLVQLLLQYKDQEVSSSTAPTTPR